MYDSPYERLERLVEKFQEDFYSVYMDTEVRMAKLEEINRLAAVFEESALGVISIDNDPPAHGTRAINNMASTSYEASVNAPCNLPLDRPCNLPLDAPCNLPA